MVGQEAINFLERCEAGGITLMNCATYVREWITKTTTRKVALTQSLDVWASGYSERRRVVKNGTKSNLGN